MSQTTQSLPEILRSIGTEISCYAHQHHPPVEPARLKSGMETVVMLATQADALADKIRTDQLRKNVRLLCLEIRQTFEPVPSGIAFHDQAEAIHYSRDTFAAAKASGMTDDLDALANMVAVELTDATEPAAINPKRTTENYRELLLQYFQACRKYETPPTKAGFAQYVGCNKSTVTRQMDDPELAKLWTQGENAFRAQVIVQPRSNIGRNRRQAGEKKKQLDED